MSAYIKLKTLEYPRHEGDIRIEHSDISKHLSGDSFPCPETYALVEYTPPPEYNTRSKMCYEGAPILENNKWVMTWIVRDMIEEEKEINSLCK
jgi:hypothetical protein